MHYTKRINNAHQLLANRSSLLAGFIDDWPIGKKKEEADTMDPGMEELAEVAREASNEIADLRHTLDFAADDERGMSEAAMRDVIDSLRQRIGRLNMVAEILDDTGEQTVMDAMLVLHEEKLRIERYCQWHRREKGVDPLRSAQPLPSRFGIPKDTKTYEFDPPK